MKTCFLPTRACLIAVCLALALTGCGKGKASNGVKADASRPAVETNTLTTPPVRSAGDPISGAPVGIGAKLGTNGGVLRIQEVIADTPAARAGLTAGQIIQSINGVPTTSMKLEDAVKLVRGAAGTTVELELVLPDSSKTQRVALVREEIVIGVNDRLVDANVGWLTLTDFNERVPGRVKKVVSNFTSLPARGLVIDLRRANSGLYPVGLDLAGFFLGNTVPLWLKHLEDQGKAKSEKGTQPQIWSGPLVVLVGTNTFGIGELLASALQANARAQILGQKTAGGARLYTLRKQPDGTTRKVVIGDFLTLKEETIFGAGIKPDLPLKAGLSETDIQQQALEALGKSQPAQSGKKAQPAAERLKQAKDLYDKGLISKEDYDKKVKEILDSL